MILIQQLRRAVVLPPRFTRRVGENSPALTFIFPPSLPPSLFLSHSLYRYLSQLFFLSAVSQSVTIKAELELRERFLRKSAAGLWSVRTLTVLDLQPGLGSTTHSGKWTFFNLICTAKSSVQTIIFLHSVNTRVNIVIRFHWQQNNIQEEIDLS